MSDARRGSPATSDGDRRRDGQVWNWQRQESKNSAFQPSSRRGSRDSTASSTRRGTWAPGRADSKRETRRGSNASADSRGSRRLSDSLPGAHGIEFGSIPGLIMGHNNSLELESELHNAGSCFMSKRIKIKRRREMSPELARVRRDLGRSQPDIPRVALPRPLPRRQVHPLGMPPALPTLPVGLDDGLDDEEPSFEDVDGGRHPTPQPPREPEPLLSFQQLQTMESDRLQTPQSLPGAPDDASEVSFDEKAVVRGSFELQQNSAITALGARTDSGGSSSSDDEGAKSRTRQSQIDRMREREARKSKLMLRRTTVNFRPSEETHSRFRMFEILVGKAWFEPLFAGLIFANTVAMAVEMQYNGIDVGHRIEVPGFNSTAVDAWPGAEQTFVLSEWIFGVLFCIELALKALAFRQDLVKDVWNWLDIACVVLWFFSVLAQSLLSLDASMFRLLRLARFMRLLRLVRTLQGCESLYLMTASIKASMLALAWSAVLIFMIQMSLALILNQLLQSYLADEAIDIGRRQEVYRYFGTFSKAFLTMFEYMLANWPPASRVLTENVNEFLIFFILGYQLLVGFAVVKVIMGVFLQVTFNVAATDDIIMVSQKERAIASHTKKISRLFMAADQDGNGVLDKMEFREMVEDPVIRQWLASMDCDVSLFARDPDMLFNLVSDGSGSLTAEQLVKGVSRMQGVARSIDLAVLAEQNREITQILENVAKDIDELKGFVTEAGGLSQEEAMKNQPKMPAPAKRRSTARSARSSMYDDEESRKADSARRGSIFSSHTDASVVQAQRILALARSNRRSSVESAKSGRQSCRASLALPGSALRASYRASSRHSMSGSNIFDKFRQTFRASVRSSKSVRPGSAGSSDSSTSGTGSRTVVEHSSTERRKAVSQAIFRVNTRTSDGWEQPEKQRCNPCRRVRQIIRSPRFEAFFGVMIFVNTLIMALEVQYDGIEVGFILDHAGVNLTAAGVNLTAAGVNLTAAGVNRTTARDVWPWAKDFFFYTNWGFLFLFALEVVLKALGFRVEFFKDPWNYFDSLIVATGFIEAFGSDSLPIDPSLLRFARLVRLLRMLRLVRSMKEFDSLHLMITSIRGSISALLWSSTLMFVVQMLIALVLNTLLENFLTVTDIDCRCLTVTDIDCRDILRKEEIETCKGMHEVYMYFGSFSKAMLTMFELTLANWIPCARALTEKVSEWYVIFALAHKFIIGFACVMVITGVFLNETFRVAATDDTIMITQKQRAIKTHTKKMSILFQAADEDGNGFLDRDEFKGMMQDDAVVTWLSSMGLDVHDVDTLFTLVQKEAENDGAITAVELVKGIAHLKGNAKSLDMAVVMHENRSLLDDTELLKMSWNIMNMMQQRGQMGKSGRRGGAVGLPPTPSNQ